MPPKPEDFQAVLERFATDLTTKFSIPASFNPEDQLKSPVADLFEALGKLLNTRVDTVTEVHVDDLAGRPDIGVSVKGRIAGYVELKASGKGANPARFRGGDKRQWEKFRDLPNLIYTDGNEWALYRNGERSGKMVRFSGDVTSDGAAAVEDTVATALFDLLREFLRWEPVVPSTPRALAHLLAPICRLLREDVLTALHNPQSNLSSLAADWRKYLFPDADDRQFADAYAQTLTYALLLARLSGGGQLSVTAAVKTIRAGHHLLADTLKILADESARQEISVPVDLLERVIDAIDTGVLIRKSKGDPWLYFYEDFLAVYDPQMRKDRGVYYTPVPVVQTQVRLVAELLEKHFDAEFSFVDPAVVTLDPAAGTGTYVLTAVEHGLDRVAQAKGPGMRANYAGSSARNVHAFEILVGPYAVAHLRLTQQILSYGGKLPDDGVHVYLTDTLESPYERPPKLPLLYKPLGEEHRRAQKIKADTPVLVCIGNPPYDRQQLSAESEAKRKGGWIRFGDSNLTTAPLLQDFLDPLTEAKLGLHAKNLYNDYVYFWRWALWKVFESKGGPGIVSFITASSYLRGPGFAGMRQVMRRTFDELWIIDLEGDNLGARKTENVFAIQTPVAIAVGVRYGEPRPAVPAPVHYARIEGAQEDKLSTLDGLTRFADIAWRDCVTGWQEPFLPGGNGGYWDWPRLTDLFPWQENGMQFKRTWPIGESGDVLKHRWQRLVSLPSGERGRSFKESEARRVDDAYPDLAHGEVLVPAIASLPASTPPPERIRYAYRSFDRQWALLDNRLCDRPRPTLQKAHSDQQVYLTSLLTNVLGSGSAAVATNLIPDLDHFRGSFGAKHVIPLWRDPAATDANITHGVLGVMAGDLGRSVSPEDLFAYSYALLATPTYVNRFWEELTIPGPRLPLTKDAGLFARAVSLGRRLLWLHTYGHRFVPSGQVPGRLPPGTARCRVGTPTAVDGYPETFGYSYADQTLRVGTGVFEKVRPQVWEFCVSGLEVVKSWLGYRMKNPAGKKSSPLDDIRPDVWQFDEELLDLLWVLDHTVDMFPELAQTLEAVLESELFTADEFPAPTEAERKGPKGLPLFEFAGVDAGEEL